MQRPQGRGIVAVKLYLLLDVVKRVGGVNGEANQDNVRVGVREGAETVVILLASSIPKSQLNVLAVDLDVGDIVFEDGGDVDLLDKVKNSESATRIWRGEKKSIVDWGCCEGSLSRLGARVGDRWGLGWCVVMHTVVGGDRG